MSLEMICIDKIISSNIDVKNLPQLLQKRIHMTKRKNMISQRDRNFFRQDLITFFPGFSEDDFLAFFGLRKKLPLVLPNNIQYPCCVVTITNDQTNEKEFWFKGYDVAEFLEYTYPGNAIMNHIKNTKLKKSWSDLVSKNCDLILIQSYLHPNTIFINEYGLYALIFGSTKPDIETIQNVIFDDYLPSLRRNGKNIISNTYSSSSSTNNPNNNNSVVLSNDQCGIINTLVGTNQQLTNKINNMEKQFQDERHQLIKQKNNRIQKLKIKNNKLEKELKNYIEMLTKSSINFVKLCEQYQSIEDNVAVMPKNNDLKHVFILYELKRIDDKTGLKNNVYMIIRRQKRSILNVINNINKNEYRIIIYEENVPNAMNIMPSIKEELIDLNVPFNVWDNNKIETSYAGFVPMVKKRFNGDHKLSNVINKM